MNKPKLVVNNLKKYFKVGGKDLHAVDNLSFYIREGETLGLVGESGCGKSTTGRAVIGLLTPDSGEIFYDGQPVLDEKKKFSEDYLRQVQMVFQDPFSSLDPRVSIGNAIAEPILVEQKSISKKELFEKVIKLMETVGINERLYGVYPHELDGGMRQRVGIARALAINPSFIVLDEPVSALDVCIQAQILNLLSDLQKEFGLTYLFISHDLSVVKFISDRIAVMYLGEIVELCDHNVIFQKPLHPYSIALLSAIPSVKKRSAEGRIILRGDVPSPVDPPSGCRFRTRCEYAQELCSKGAPIFREILPERFVACHFAEQFL